VFDFFVPKVRGKRVRFQTVSVGEENEIKKISQQKGFENSYNFGWEIWVLLATTT
jgi:hypothetical protein